MFKEQIKLSWGVKELGDIELVAGVGTTLFYIDEPMVYITGNPRDAFYIDFFPLVGLYEQN